MPRLEKLRTNLRALAGALLLVGAPCCQGTKALDASNSAAEAPAPKRELALPIEGVLPELDATEWLHSTPQTGASLRGKVVLVQFWTYTCINWRRTLPYVRAWFDRYRRLGLVVIGVHSPEFEFEKDLGNVREATRDIGLEFPIAVDSDHLIWSAFGNEYWPALYFVDAKGRIRHHHFGEGDYERSEAIIQDLLVDAGAEGVPRGASAVRAGGAELDADWANLRSPESYLGYERADSFAALASTSPGQRRVHAAPDALRVNQWGLAGDWTFGNQAVVLERPPGRIVYRFHARDLHLVMGSAPTTPVRFRVRIDGQAPGAAHGVDVDGDGNGTVNEARMYQLLRQPGPIVDRDFEIEFFAAPLRGFSFTFG